MVDTNIQSQGVRTDTSAGPVQTEAPQRVYQKKKTIFRFYQIVWYILGFIEILLGFRFVLKLLAANPTSGFTSLVYSTSDTLVAPFRGIFKAAASEGSVLEWSTIIAAIVYAVVAYGLVQLMQLVKPAMPDEVERTVDSQ